MQQEGSSKPDETGAMPCFQAMINDKKVSLCQRRTAHYAKGGHALPEDLAQAFAIQSRQKRLTRSVPHKETTPGVICQVRVLVPSRVF